MHAMITCSSLFFSAVLVLTPTDFVCHDDVPCLLQSGSTLR